VETRLRLLEEWRVRHRDEYASGVGRLDQVWDWMTVTKGQLRTVSRLLWLVLGALIANAGLVVWAHR